MLTNGIAEARHVAVQTPASTTELPFLNARSLSWKMLSICLRVSAKDFLPMPDILLSVEQGRSFCWWVVG